MSDAPVTVTLWLPERTARGPGGHFYNYVSCRAGDELAPGSPRGWGQTKMEAERSLAKEIAPVNPLPSEVDVRKTS